MPTIVHSSSSEFRQFAQVRGVGAISATPLLPSRQHRGRTKALVAPFFDRFSPFSTVFPGGLDRNLFDDSRVRPFSTGRAAVRKRRKRRKRSCRSSQLADLAQTLAAENWPAKQRS